MRSSDQRRASFQQGHAAEAFVAELLEEQGFRILERNLRIGGAELDVVACRAGAVRFVEVKARAVGDDSGLESLDHRKQRKLIRGAEAWLAQQAESFAEVAFLVALVTLRPDAFEVEWIDNAFDA